MAENGALSHGWLCRRDRLMMAQNEAVSEGEHFRPAFVLLIEHVCSRDVHRMVRSSVKQQNEEHLFLLCHRLDEISLIDQLKTVNRSI